MINWIQTGNKKFTIYLLSDLLFGQIKQRTPNVQSFYN